MTTEVLMLAATGGLLLLLTVFQGTRNVLALGLSTAAGNQHDIAPWTGWNDRLNRAIRNLMEAIAIFVPIVIAVQIAPVVGAGDGGLALDEDPVPELAGDLLVPLVQGLAVVRVHAAPDLVAAHLISISGTTRELS